MKKNDGDLKLSTNIFKKDLVPLLHFEMYDYKIKDPFDNFFSFNFRKIVYDVRKLRISHDNGDKNVRYEENTCLPL